MGRIWRGFIWCVRGLIGLIFWVIMLIYRCIRWRKQEMKLRYGAGLVVILGGFVLLVWRLVSCG